MKSKTSTEILGTLANTVFRHGQARRTNVPFHHGEPVKEAQAELCTAMLELVGEQWPLDDDLPDQQKHNRQVLNGQIYELRTAIKNYFNQEDKKEL